MRKLGQLLAVTAFAVGVSAGAAPAVTLQDYQDKPIVTAGDLAMLCAAKPDGGVGTAAVNFCHGYARGAIAVQLLREAATRRPLKLFCFPDPAPAPGPTLEGFAAWVNANPAHGREKAADGLFSFLGEKYPCRK